MEMKRIRGGVGRRSLKECGVSDDVPHVFCRSRQEWVLFMKEMRRLLRDADHKAQLTASDQTELEEQLHIFKESMDRRINLVMGESATATRRYHVTQWAVIQYFMLVTWNRAFCRGDVKVLTKDIDVRWQAWFAPLVDEVGDVTKQPMALAMRFLGYHCPMP